MSIQIINTGTSPNSGNGDSLRLAFHKVNQNFALLTTNTPSIDAGLKNNFVYYKDNGAIVSGTNLISINTQTNSIFLKSNIIPENNLYDLGSTTNYWNDIYLNGSVFSNGEEILSTTTNFFIKIQNTNTDAVHYLSFTNSNNNNPTLSKLFTTSTVYVVPSTGLLLTGQIKQTSSKIALGATAGNTNQGEYAISIGEAGSNNQSSGAIAIGLTAGIESQGSNSIAIGSNAGKYFQSDNAISIGNNAGNINQNTNAIAIGYNAGVNDQSSYSIIINAGIGVLNANNPGLYIDPIATQDVLSDVHYILFNNADTKEINTSSNISIYPNIGKIKTPIVDTTLIDTHAFIYTVYNINEFDEVDHTYNYDLTSSTIFKHVTTFDNFIVNIVDTVLQENDAVNMHIHVYQTSTAYTVDSLSINSINRTILWKNNTPPTPNSNKLDIFNFSILKTNASVYTVIGDLVTYG